MAGTRAQTKIVTSIPLTDAMRTCPLSGEVFRHPVLGQDGVRYELKALVYYMGTTPSAIENGQLISPVKKVPITPVVYDENWKDMLDQEVAYGKGVHEDRYDDYEIGDMLERINHPGRQPIMVDENGRPLSIAIGNEFVKNFFKLFIGVSVLAWLVDGFSGFANCESGFVCDNQFKLGLGLVFLTSVVLDCMDARERIATQNQSTLYAKVKQNVSERVSAFADRYYYSLFNPAPAPAVNEELHASRRLSRRNFSS